MDTFQNRFNRWKNGENYWIIRNEAIRRTSDPREQYDYVGYFDKYGTLEPSDQTNGHYTDEFKLPLHPTFSDESVYSTKNTPGGHWSKDGTKFYHSKYTINHPEETRLYLKQNDPNVKPIYKGGVVLPEVKITPKKLSGYKGGKDYNNPEVEAFVDDMAPLVAERLTEIGKPEAFDNVMRQIAIESKYGQSRAAKVLNNYGGVRLRRSKEYMGYPNKKDFVKYHLGDDVLLNDRYEGILDTTDPTEYATIAKKGGYYEASLKEYASKMRNMKTLDHYTKQWKGRNTSKLKPPVKRTGSQLVQNLEDGAYNFQGGPNRVPLSLRPPIKHYAEGKDQDTYFAGTLPEVEVKPNAVMRRYFNEMRPSIEKGAALDLAKDWDQQRNDAGVGDPKLSYQFADGPINKTIDVWKMAGSPNISSIDPINNRFRDGTKRAYISYGLFRKPIIRNAQSWENVVSELSHPMQLKYGSNSIVKDIISDLFNGKLYHPDNKNRYNQTWYERDDGSEYETHSVIQPMLNDYIYGDIYRDKYKLLSGSKYQNEVKYYSTPKELLKNLSQLRKR